MPTYDANVYILIYFITLLSINRYTNSTICTLLSTSGSCINPYCKLSIVSLNVLLPREASYTLSMHTELD